MPVNFAATVKAPPRKTSRQVAQASVPTQTQSLQEMREQGLNGLAQLGQGVCLATGQFADAATIGQYAPPLVREIATLANQYEWLAKPVDYLIQVGPFAAFLTVLAPFAMQMLTNHRVINATGAMGVVAPETLSAQMQAQMVRMQADAMREQLQAQRELDAANAEVQVMMAEANDRTTVQG